MIAIQNLQRVFRGDHVETQALRDVDLAIETGEFVAVMGPSGSGKSTLLNILGLIDRPTSGKFTFMGEDVSGQNEKQLTELRRRHLGFIFQSFNLIDELTVAENIQLGLTYRRTNRQDHRARVQAAMDRVGIGHRANHFPHQLSGGQQQRAAIARAVVSSPSLILADEPTGNLDSFNGQQVMEILQQLNEDGATIIMVTHSPAHADQARRAINMLDGTVVSTARFLA